MAAVKDYPDWLRAGASKGGSATTEAKARAARRNGRKGGRPKKPNAERKKVVGGGGAKATKRSGSRSHTEKAQVLRAGSGASEHSEDSSL